MEEGILWNNKIECIELLFSGTRNMVKFLHELEDVRMILTHISLWNVEIYAERKSGCCFFECGNQR